jgi:hypothetical protein
MSGIGGAWLGAVAGMCGAALVGSAAAYLAYALPYAAARKGSPEAAARFAPTPTADAASGPSWRRRLPAALALAILAVPTLWLAHQAWRYQRQQRALRELTNAGRMYPAARHFCGPPWLEHVLRSLWGIDLFDRVDRIVLNGNPSPREWVLLDRLTEVKGMYVYCQDFGDKDIEALAERLCQRPVALEMVVSRSPLTDRGVGHLASLQRVTHLELLGTKLTDDGLPALYALTGLKHLRITGAGVTAQGVRRLRQALPQTSVEVEPEPSSASPTP